ncbi:MAG TPA: tetratricopeptide repeat protein [Gemmatimonadota bacterium]|nr:tetratricopeptide repeat protein [Gemmatimonadota bacterium]
MVLEREDGAMSWWRFWERDERDDERPPDYYAEGVDLTRQERYHEALTSFRLALRERPDDLATLEQMAVVYTRIGMTDEALKTYGRVLERESGRPAAHYGAGFLLLNRGREEEAVEHLEAFLRQQPDTPDAERHVRHARDTLERLRSSPDAGDGEEAPGTDQDA